MGLWLYHNCCGILHKIPSAYYYRSGRLNIVKNLVERKQCNVYNHACTQSSILDGQFFTQLVRKLSIQK